MPTYSIQGPDGKTYSIDGPEGASKEQVVAKIKARAASQPKDFPGLSAAITDIPSEIDKSLTENQAGIRSGLPKSLGGSRDMSKEGLLEGLGKTAGGIGSMLTAGLPAALQGIARSLIGHPMAQAEHAVGGMIAPETAKSDNPEEMYKKAKGDVDLATSVVGHKGGPAVLGELSSAKKLAETEKAATNVNQKQLQQSYRTNYLMAEEHGTKFEPEKVKELSESIFPEDGIHDEILSPKAFKLVEKLAPPAKKGEEPAIRTTVAGIENVRKKLNALAGGPDKYEKSAAVEAIKRIDEFMGEVPHLKDARGDYATREKILLLQRAMENARRKARGGLDYKAKLISELEKIRDKKSRGFSPDQMKMIEDIVEKSSPLDWVGRMAPGKVVDPLAVIGPGAGFLAGGPVGAAAAPIAGVGAKLGSNFLAKRAAKDLIDAISRGSPLAKKDAEVRAFLKSQGLTDGSP